MLALSAFFSGMEIAFVSRNRLLAEMDNDGGLSHKLISKFDANPNAFVSTMLVGNNIVLVVYGILIATLADNTVFRGMDASVTVPANSIVSTIIVLFTGEFVPKAVFKGNPNRLLALFAPMAYAFYLLLWPVSRFSTWLSGLLMRLVGVRQGKEEGGDAFTRLDLDYLLQTSIEAAGNGGVEDEVKIFQNALDFGDTKVRDCMVPRTEIRAVDETATAAELLQMFTESGLSKILVHKGDIDHIAGYIHSSEMFRSAGDWTKAVRDILFVPETMPAKKLMRQFMQQKKSIAVVVDEFGGTSGIVALEDIVEEIFGDIEDEHDSDTYVAKQTAPGEYLVSARLEIGKVNEKLGLALPESDEYMTVGGLILHEYQNFPKPGEVVAAGRYAFKVEKITATKIELVSIRERG